jgi:hypothetical protein
MQLGAVQNWGISVQMQRSVARASAKIIGDLGPLIIFQPSLKAKCPDSDSGVIKAAMKAYAPIGHSYAPREMHYFRLHR